MRGGDRDLKPLAKPSVGGRRGGLVLDLFGLGLALRSLLGREASLDRLDLRAVGHEDHAHAAAGHARRSLDLREVGEAFDHLAHADVAAVAVGHLASASEVLHDLHAVAFDQEAPRLVDADLDVVRIDLHRSPEPDLLHLGDLALRPAGTVLLRLLVAELAVVHDPAHRRTHVGGDLHEVEPGVGGAPTGLVGLDDAHHLPGLVDQTDRRDADPVVHPRPAGSGLASEGSSHLRYGSVPFRTPESKWMDRPPLRRQQHGGGWRRTAATPRDRRVLEPRSSLKIESHRTRRHDRVLVEAVGHAREDVLQGKLGGTRKGRGSGTTPDPVERTSRFPQGQPEFTLHALCAMKFP